MALTQDQELVAGDPLEARFRSWVAEDGWEPRALDLEAAYRHFGLPITGQYSGYDLITHVEGRIKELLTTPKGQNSFSAMRRLEEQFHLRALVDGMPLEPFRSVISFIKEAMRDDRPYADLDDEDRWREAVRLASECLQLGGGYHPESPEEAVRLSGRTKALAYALRYLRAQGYEVTIFRGEPVMMVDEARRLATRLEALIESLGPMNTMVDLFRAIQHTFDYPQGRYLLARSYGEPRAFREPTIPVGYLLQLTAKLVNNVSLKPFGGEDDWQELLALARAFGAVFNSEPYYNMEVMIRPADTLISSLDELATYDSLFTFPQLRPTDVARLLMGLFDWVGEPESVQLGATIAEFAELAVTILAVAPDQGRYFFTAADLQEAAGTMAPAVVSHVLSVFSHPAGTVNAAFQLPHEQEAVTFSQRPLIALDGGTYVLLNRSWCAPAFYEALAIHARATLGEGVETQIGLAFERLVRTLLGELNVPVVSGKYKVDKQDGECDAVVDTPDTWIFIETKKKALTRPSRGAKTVNIVTDLAKSMIDMQAQLGQHEVLLRQQGNLLLDDSGQTHEVVLGDKGVERVAIALLDYGSFQDRVVIQGMLEGLAGRELCLTSIKTAGDDN